jgi:hypothetical protein
MSVELSDEEKSKTSRLKWRGYWPVKSEAREEAHALSSTQKRKGEQGTR